MGSVVYGNFHDKKQPENEEYLSLQFSPSRLPLKKRWENNGLSADFISEYFKIFYISSEEEPEEANIKEVVLENIRNSVKYVANELLENAMKFQAPTEYPTVAQIFLSLYEKRLVFYITHSITLEQSTLFQQFIEQLLANDPKLLYFEAMRDSAREENAQRSGIGLLSMICDYEAQLGWKFETLQDSPLISVTAMVTLGTGV
ncbi:MAG: ATP-binding protein [Thiotrichaceae bacterium]|nr:ATP-binding protein [Thiotrichaceae bacterium]